MKFSERIGQQPLRETFQTNSMDLGLRNRLWNVLESQLTSGLTSTVRDSRFLENIPLLRFTFVSLWDKEFRLATDTIPSHTPQAVKELREIFFRSEWFKVYDILEHILTMPVLLDEERAAFASKLNSVLEQEMAGYRIVDNIISPLTSAGEIKAISDALDNTQTKKLEGVQTHLRTALDRLSDREQPDYRNSIKESISAIESIAKIIAGDEKATLGHALKKVGTKIEIHKSLENAFSSLYGYTSDHSGIRHALIDTPDVDFDDAKFMLVSCSAFVSFLVGKCAKAGISLK